MENGQKSAEWEAQVFNRSRTREEYVKLVATLIWKLRRFNEKNNEKANEAIVLHFLKGFYKSQKERNQKVYPKSCILFSSKQFRGGQKSTKINTSQ